VALRDFALAMPALLATLSAAIFGVGDFLGGLASRRVRAVVVAGWSQLVGLILVSALALALPTTHPGPADLWWGVAGGLAGAAGLLLLYTALSTGPMSVAAPITALFSAIVPLVAGFGFGERPGLLALVGVLLAFPAIVLIARAEEDRSLPHPAEATFVTLLPAFGAGVGFGLFFVCLQRTSHDAGLWPLVSARSASMTVLFLLVAVTPGRNTLADGATRLVVACGVCDVSANALYLAAVNHGLLSLIAVLAALYPASTVVLARVVLHERMTRGQLFGLALAGLAAACVAAGG
jgi:drug/metabolite transporter (DMT)-like permease